MTGALITVGVNTLAFYLISEMVPGFDVKSKKTAFLMAISYSFLAALAWLVALPLSLALAFVFAILAFIPLIGPLLSGAGLFITTFGLLFGVSFILLLLIDRVMDDFNMRSKTVAVIASVMLGVLGVLMRVMIG